MAVATSRSTCTSLMRWGGIGFFDVTDPTDP